MNSSMSIKMLNALRSSTRTQPILFSTPLPNQIAPKASSVRFMQHAPSGGTQPEKNSSMDKNSKPSSKTADSMSSFGEGYASRSDEEGFGGVYGGNQYLNKQDEECIMDGKTTEHDASQGSVVKEKETSRNQKNV